MNLKILENEQSKLLKKAIRVYNRQHKAIAENIANVDNPAFKRVRTDFSEVLREAEDVSNLRYSDPRHIRSPHFSSDINHPGESDKNQPVDMTREMSELAENQIRHEFAVRTLHGYYEKLKQAIASKIA